MKQYFLMILLFSFSFVRSTTFQEAVSQLKNSEITSTEIDLSGQEISDAEFEILVAAIANTTIAKIHINFANSCISKGRIELLTAGFEKNTTTIKLSFKFSYDSISPYELCALTRILNETMERNQRNI